MMNRLTTGEYYTKTLSSIYNKYVVFKKTQKVSAQSCHHYRRGGHQHHGRTTPAISLGTLVQRQKKLV